MEFEQIDFLTPLKEFLEQSPFYRENLHFSFMAIDAMASTNTEAVGFSNGTNPNTRHFVDGSFTVTTNKNFNVLFRRKMDANEERKIQGNFFSSLIDWVNEKQLERKFDENSIMPVFGNNKNERITASGGFLMGTDPNGLEIYQIQLAVSFDTDYKGENTWQ